MTDVFAQLAEIGLLDVILPFILIFTIVFAVLNKVKLFGIEPETRKYNVMIALVMGMAVIFPHVLGYYPPDGDIVNIINQSLPHVSVVLVAIVMGLLIIGVLGKRFEIGGNSLSGVIAIGAFALVLYIFGNAANWWNMPGWLMFVTDPNLMALIIVILVFAIIIWFVTKDDALANDQRFKEEFQKRKLSNQMSSMLK